MLNRTTFFAYARRAPFGGRLLQDQVSGMEAILKAWEASGLTNLDWLAYMLATAFHETNATMQPIKELGGAAYLTKNYDVKGRDPARARSMGNTEPGDGPRYCGRGYVQLTWKVNYQKASKVVGADLVKNPDLAMKPNYAAAIMINGMVNGWFTGKKLADYFGSGECDAVNARRIINGTDKAKLIAGYFEAFKGAVEAADTATPQPADVAPQEAKPDDVKPSESKSLWSMLIAFLTGGGGLTFLGGIDSPWKLAALGLLVVSAIIGIWLVSSGRIEIKRLMS